MTDINIISRRSLDSSWQFTVTVGDVSDQTQHTVTIDKKYWQKLTNENLSPEELLEDSFHFLLTRERKESILPRFNLKQINDYFPEFEQQF